MDLCSSLSSGSDCEQTLAMNELSIEDDVFGEAPSNQGGFSWAEVASGKRNLNK